MSKRAVLGSIISLASMAMAASSVEAGFPLPGTLPKEQRTLLFCSVSDTLMAKDCGLMPGVSASAITKRISAFIQLETDAPDYLAGATPGAHVWIMVRRSLAAPLDGANPGRAAASGSMAPVTDPDWSTMPGSADISGYFPERAQRLGASGTATARCTVGPGGDLLGCWVPGEDPSQMGFGQATLNVSAGVQMKQVAKDGSPTAGRPYVLQAAFAAGSTRITLSTGR